MGHRITCYDDQVVLGAQLEEFIRERHAAGRDTEWRQIADHVRATGWDITNWLHVRHALQSLTTGIERTDDIRKEFYTVVD